MTDAAQQAATRIRTRYEGETSRRLHGYLGVGEVYAAAASLAGLGSALGVRLPGRLSLGDTVLLSLATHIRDTRREGSR